MSDAFGRILFSRLPTLSECKYWSDSKNDDHEAKPEDHWPITLVIA